MSDQPASSRSIAFWRDYDKRRPYVVATTKTEDPEAPIELVRPYGDGSGDEVLVSLTRAEWTQLVTFIAEEASLDVACMLEDLYRRSRSPFAFDDPKESTT